MVKFSNKAIIEDRMREMNEALLLGSLRQQELAEASDALNLQLLREIAERKQAEETVRESEQRLHTLFELGPVAVYSCDASGQIQDFNRRAVELWGRQPTRGDPRERFCGSFKLFRPDGSFLPHEQCPMADVSMGKISEVIDGEVVVERPDGSRLSVVVNIRPLKNQSGQITGAINCFYDVTERVRSEAAISASEAQYRTLFNSIDEGFCVIEKIETRPGEPVDFRYLEANPAFERQTGVSGVVGKTIREAFPGEPQEWFNTYDAILGDGEPIRFERELVTQGRVLELYAFPLEDPGQRRLAVVFQDITARKNAEEVALRLAAIVRSSEDAILSTDIDGIITSWNRGAEKLFGYTAEETIGKHVTILVPLDQENKGHGFLGRIRNGQHIDPFDTVWMRKDGSTVWVSLSVSPLINAEGEVIGASKIIRDMTERRRADEHRTILIGELNHRAKNLLAMVQAIASQTLGSAASLEAAKSAFESRLGALARGHDLLTHGNWVGTDLASVVKATVEPHGGGVNRFRVEGPVVELTPATALTFTLALHELCTNAAKYGALSQPNGNVSIMWHVTGHDAASRLHLLWTEKDGPAVNPPTQRGFGSRLIEKVLGMELGGEVRISYEPTGVICTIDAPLPAQAGKKLEHAL
ncbi:MAG TPA: PAS domain S-box protein [Aestuariivirga sp.]|nr:PAS domain S-box protein [Aestuariivirga sp.]